jgi:inner membrane protein
MASPLAHFIAGVALAFPFTSRWSTLAAAGAIAVAPDLDLPIRWVVSWGPGHFFGHRGIAHSPLFLALVISLAAWRWAGPGWRTKAIAWSLAASSHGVLDAFTNHGPGVMLLFPFNAGRYFFPWRPIEATPVDPRLFLQRAGRIFASEVPFVAAIAAIGAVMRAARGRRV